MPHSNQEQDNTSSHLFPPSTDRMQCRFCRRFLGRGASLIAHLVKNPLQCRRPPFDSWVGKIRWRRDRLIIPVFLGFPSGSAGKESACNVGDLGSIPRLGRSPEVGSGYPLQYSGLENSMDCIILGRKELDMTERLPLRFTSALQIFSPRPANAVLLSTDRCLHDHSSKTQDIPSLI